jgi:hypothetical protein
MQQVTEKWKTEQRKHIRPESYIELKYSVTDPTAQADATASANNEWVHSKTAELTNEQDRSFITYPTLEHNSWILDGTRIFYNDTTDFGYVSDVVSGRDGTFEVHPTITIAFSKVHENLIPGMTFVFSTAFDEYATEFIVRSYNGETMTAEKTVTKNQSVTAVVEMDISNFDKIVLEIVKWGLPNHRARLESIGIGITQTYTKDDLISFDNNIHADLVSAELPDFEIIFELNNVDASWNPYNPDGASKYLIKRQEIVVRYGYKVEETIEWIKGGRYFMSEWDTPTNGITAKFTARGITEYMTDKFDKKNVVSPITLYNLCETAFLQSKIPTLANDVVRWKIDDSLKNISVNLPEDFDHTNAETVQLCANAARCIMNQDRDGIMHIEPLKTVDTDYLIDEFVSYSNADNA